MKSPDSINVLKRDYEKFRFLPHSADFVLDYLSNRYGLFAIRFEDMDQVWQSVFLSLLKDYEHVSVGDFRIFALNETPISHAFFSSVRKQYEESAGVYVFQKADVSQLFSNCSVLEMLMVILSGINEEDMVNETPQYFYYLLQFQLFEKHAKISWEDYFMNQREPVD